MHHPQMKNRRKRLSFPPVSVIVLFLSIRFDPVSAEFARKKVLANAELREQTLNDQGEDPQDDAADRSASEEPEDHNMDASMDLAAEVCSISLDRICV